MKPIMLAKRGLPFIHAALKARIRHGVARLKTPLPRVYGFSLLWLERGALHHRSRAGWHRARFVSKGIARVYSRHSRSQCFHLARWR